MPQNPDPHTFLSSDENARARALQRAMGYTRYDLTLPRIGVANSWGETSPGHIHLRAVADAVKAGIWQAGGTPFEFGSMAMCPMAVGAHGMRYDTPTRDIIAAEVEASAWLHMFDALVLVSSCDKNVPGHLLAAARLGLPAIVVPGGPMLAGRGDGDMDTTDLDIHCYAAGVGRPTATRAELDAMEEAACPGAGACALLGTANTMQCLSEALGMSLPRAGTAPAVSAERLWLAKASGRQIVALVNAGITARDVLSPAALRNAIRALHALAGSTNAVVHLLALAEELDLADEIDLDLIEALGRETPCITSVRPSGPHTVEDLHRAGGMPATLKGIEGLLETEALTVTGSTVGANLADVAAPDSAVIGPRAATSAARGHAREGLAVLRGSLAESAVVRPTVVPEPMLRHRGPARVFNGEDEALEALRGGLVQPGEVLVLRYEGPRGGPGLNEVFKVVGYMRALGLEERCALVTDGKISGFAKGPFVCQVCPEAALGGPLALVEDGDIIAIDVPGRRLDLAVDPDTLAARRAAWQAPRPRVTEGLLTLYTRLALPASRGAGLEMRL